MPQTSDDSLFACRWFGCSELHCDTVTFFGVPVALLLSSDCTLRFVTVNRGKVRACGCSAIFSREGEVSQAKFGSQVE